MQGAQNKSPSMKKEATQNARGSKQKTSDEKRGNPKTQGAQGKRPPMKKRQSQNARDSRRKTSNEKRGNLTQKQFHKPKIKNC
jgi:hypothetical protein